MSTESTVPQGQQHNPANLQEVLDSAANADATGMQQFFTPLDIAAALFLPLTAKPAHCLDLHMGAGHLLLGSGAKVLLGVDIDPRLARKPDKAPNEWSCANADATLLYNLLKEVGFHADLIALNPPFSQKQYTSRLAAMAESECDAVRLIYNDLAGRETIDSTLVAALMLVDLLGPKGDGFLICNQATAVRLFGAPDRPSDAGYSDKDLQCEGLSLREHAWLWLTLPPGIFENVYRDFETAVIYFTRHNQRNLLSVFSRTKTNNLTHLTAPHPSAAAIEHVLEPVMHNVYAYRKGERTYSASDFNQGAGALFFAAKNEYARIHRGQRTNAFNLWLENGKIQRQLTSFQQCSLKLPKDMVIALNGLKDRSPMELVVQRDTRRHLQEAVRCPFWRVDPKLLAKVDEAVSEYHSNRAPFYPLSPVLRLGFLDESDTIQCSKAVGPFKQGVFYPLQCSTAHTERDGERINILGMREDVTYMGQELVVRIIPPGKRADSWSFTNDPKITKDLAGTDQHTMAELLEHFVIPDVPDVAVAYPEKYQANLAAIRTIEARVNAGHSAERWWEQEARSNETSEAGEAGASTQMTAPANHEMPLALTTGRAAKGQPFSLREYQRSDLARLAVHDGGICGWEPGLGKTCGIGIFSLIKRARRTLIVAPDSLHQQIIDDLFDLMGIVVHPLCSQEDYLASKPLRQANLDLLRHGQSDVCGWWITSYTMLGMNGADEFAGKVDDKGQHIVTPTTLRNRTLHPGYDATSNLGIGESQRGILCLMKPSLATLIQDLFECVEVDEGVRLKSTESYTSMGVRKLRPKHRAIMTGTPIKNRLDDIFWLCHWAAGGNAEASARWPYANSNAAKEEFAGQHMLIERNHTREQNSALAGKPRRYEKRTAQITNIHSLWKKLCNVCIRRRKTDIGEDIVPKTIIPITVPMGKTQKAVYSFHVQHAPEFTKTGDEMNAVAAIVTQLQNLRQAALCPDSPNLGTERLSLNRIRIALTELQPQAKGDPKATSKAVSVALKATSTPFAGEAGECLRIVQAMLDNKRGVNLQEVYAAAPNWRGKFDDALKPITEERKLLARSPNCFNPKQQAILLKIEELLNQGEQAVVMSPFQWFSQSLYNMLCQAGVKVVMLDGNTSPAKRGQYSKAFKRREYSVLIGGIQSMGEGHSWDQCSNLFLPSLEWAFDKNRQAEDRVHRLTSKKPVTIYSFVTEGSIDQRLFSLYQEKGESSSLALDGSLFSDHVEELSLGQLLNEAIAAFDSDTNTMDEAIIERDWQALKGRLRFAQQRYQEFYPGARGTAEASVTPTQMRKAVEGTGYLPIVTLVKGVPKLTFGALLGTRDERIIDAVIAEFMDFCAGSGFADWRAAWKAYDAKRTIAKPAVQRLAPPKPQPTDKMNDLLKGLRNL